MDKQYDRAYFDRWYRGRGIGGGQALAHKVAAAVAVAEYHLGRPIRSVLDVGCGEGAWRAPLLKLRPRVSYLGLDSSEYAIARYGRSRNLRPARFGDMAWLRPGPPVDLLVCADVMHYVPDAELRRGLSGFAELCSGMAFLEVYGADDAIDGDMEGFIPRPAAVYRRAFGRAGFAFCGPHCWLSPARLGDAAALEVG
ncbi:class I SAM-dependent methyltransferase [Coralloluteibacterium thermophilus]|uniref:Class I SAM-dependent methyltransferase n=1 Tax=Coralloluteibacterium thermophilum TaxID=2707049 RepID=A0ABV9NIX6_9GAMM